jgi:hypothetical protein
VFSARKSLQTHSLSSQAERAGNAWHSKRARSATPQTAIGPDRCRDSAIHPRIPRITRVMRNFSPLYIPYWWRECSDSRRQAWSPTGMPKGTRALAPPSTSLWVAGLLARKLVDRVNTPPSIDVASRTTSSLPMVGITRFGVVGVCPPWSNSAVITRRSDTHQNSAR